MSTSNPAALVPLKWSKSYEGKLSQLERTPVNCLLVEGGDRPSQLPAGLTAVTKEDLKQSVTFVAEPKWPSVQSAARGGGGGGGGFTAGPTGVPWVDANGFMIRLAQALDPDKPVWVDPKPPDNTNLNSCLLAVADCAAFGARWVVSPGNAFQLEGDWRKIAGALEFFEKHAEWKAFEPAASLGILSDFSGLNEFLGSEVLNLIARRQVCYRVLIESKTKSLAGLTAVVFAEEKPPAGATLDLLTAWVREGGLLLAPVGTKLGSPSAEQYPGYGISKLGKGRVAVPKEPWSDPFLVAQDAHLLMSRRQDLLRLFNYGAVNSHYVRSRDGKKGVVQLLNYSRRAQGHPMTLAMAEKYRTGRIYTFDSVTSLKPAEAARGVEFPLPPFDVYAAIEMEK